MISTKGTCIGRVGPNHIYIRCVYGIFGRDFTKYTVFTAFMYGSGQPYMYTIHNACIPMESLMTFTYEQSCTEDMRKRFWPGPETN
jgi:hypothetical protein